MTGARKEQSVTIPMRLARRLLLSLESRIQDFQDLRETLGAHDPGCRAVRCECCPVMDPYECDCSLSREIKKLEDDALLLALKSSKKKQ
jgi:hypothetical protein